MAEPSPELEYWCISQVCVDPVWEAAYRRFETEAEEQAKFLQRFRWLGIDQWPRDLEIVNLFCGTGEELKALAALGFERLEGVDLSADLLQRCPAGAKLYVGDCRELKLPDASRDAIIVQGGLHHLPTLPEDFVACLDEIRRVLKPGGRFAVVEPWWTPFLRGVHFAHSFSLPRRMWAKLDALAVMTEQEAETYFNWLGRARELRPLFDERFQWERKRIRWGKFMAVGTPR